LTDIANRSEDGLLLEIFMKAFHVTAKSLNKRMIITVIYEFNGLKRPGHKITKPIKNGTGVP